MGFDLRLELRAALIPLWETRRIVDTVRAAQSLAERLGDRRRLGAALRCMASSLWQTSQLEEAGAAARRSLAIAAEVGDLSLRVTATFTLGQIDWDRGDYRAGTALLRRNVETLAGDHETESFGEPLPMSIAAMGFLARCLAELGRFPERIACGEEALQAGEVLGNVFGIMNSSISIGFLYVRKGDLRKAIGASERGRSTAEASNLPALYPAIQSLLGQAYLLSGRVAEALPLLERAAELPIVPVGALILAVLREGYLVTGRLEEAQAVGLRALALARERHQRGYEAWTLRGLGEIWTRSQPLEPERGEGYYRQALALAEELGMRPLVAHCHRGFGELERRLGNARQAQDHLEQARAMFDEMDMRFWLAGTTDT